MFHRGLDYSMYSTVLTYTIPVVVCNQRVHILLGISASIHSRTALRLGEVALLCSAAMSREADRIASAQQTLDSTPAPSLPCFSCIHLKKTGPPKVLYDMSQLLGTQLDKETLATCIGMIESGVNPEALAVRV